MLPITSPMNNPTAPDTHSEGGKDEQQEEGVGRGEGPGAGWSEGEGVAGTGVGVGGNDAGARTMVVLSGKLLLSYTAK